MATPTDVRKGVASHFKVTRGFGDLMANAKVEVSKLYLREISSWGEPDAMNNWGIYDSAHGSNEKRVATGHDMHTPDGKWNSSFTLVFEDERFEGSTLQVMGANDQDEVDNEWAIVGGTGEFAMARGIIQRRLFSEKGSIKTYELTINFFCFMKEIVPPPTKRVTVGGNRGIQVWEMEGKSQRLENVTIYHSLGVEGFQFSYVNEDGEVHSSPIWGFLNPDPLRKTEIKFGPISEFVTKMIGAERSDGLLTRFEIVTTHKTYGPFGIDPGSPTFSNPVPEGETVVGFFANTNGTYVTLVGVYTI